MITFSVIKEQNGWSIRMGEWSMTPFWSRELAIREANCLAEAIRCHGECTVCTEVIIDDADPEPQHLWNNPEFKGTKLTVGHYSVVG